MNGIIILVCGLLLLMAIKLLIERSFIGLILFCVVGIWGNNEVIANMWNKKSSIMKMNLGYVSLAFTVSSAVIIFNSLLEIVDHVKRLTKKEEQEEEV